MLGKTTAAPRAALPSPTRACWVCSRFRHTPNSDMDYRILAWSFFCVRTHTGVGHTDESAQHFWPGKTLTCLCVCSWRGSNLMSLISSLWRSTHWATQTPRSVIAVKNQLYSLTCCVGVCKYLYYSLGMFNSFAACYRNIIFSSQRVQAVKEMFSGLSKDYNFSRKNPAEVAKIWMLSIRRRTFRSQICRHWQSDERTDSCVFNSCVQLCI